MSRKAITTFAVSGVVWAAIAMLSVFQMYVSRIGEPEPVPVTTLLIVQATPWLAWWLATPIVLQVVRTARWDRVSWRRSAVLHAGTAMVLALLPSLVSVSGWHLVDPLPESLRGYWVEYRALLGLRYLFDVTTYAAIAAIATGATFYRRAQDEASRRSQMAAELATSRLRALTAQVHPHFLFNALNGVAMLIRAGDSERALRSVVAYGDVLRDMLDAPDRDGTVDEEFRWLARYAEVESLRFPDHLDVDFEADPASRRGLLPRFLLQPVVENALRHGVATDRPTQVRIRARLDGDRLRLAVTDNGPGIPAPLVPGVGLRSTRARLEARFGDQARLNLRAVPAGGTEAEIVIPFIEEPLT